MLRVQSGRVGVVKSGLGGYVTCTLTCALRSKI